MNGWASARAVSAFALLGVCACTARSGADPFASGPSTPRDGVRGHVVRIEVGCNGCLIRYTLGTESYSHAPDRSNQYWSRRLRRFPRQPETIRVTAATSPDGGELRFVRIVVDGDVVAEDDGGGTDPGGSARRPRTLSAETVIGDQ